jgi:adenylate cyclase
MSPAMLRPSPFRRFLLLVVACCVIGALYSSVRHRRPANGGAAGASMAAALFAVERLVLRRNAGGLFRPLPFLVYLGLRTTLYVGVMVLINAALDWLMFGEFIQVSSTDFLFTLALVVGFNLLFSVNDLLGPGTLFAFAAGRYYAPRIEERALLFIDMRSSTAVAERLGELAFLNFLNRFVADVSVAVTEAGGEIHKYVGDEVIATWRLAPGANEPACVRACFAAIGRLDAQQRGYERMFGQRADLRAGLHCGPVAVGELGSVKKEIALIGDTMNTAQRVEEACRATTSVCWRPRPCSAASPRSRPA